MIRDPIKIYVPLIRALPSPERAIFVPKWIIALVAVGFAIVAAWLTSFLLGRNPLPFPDGGSRLFTTPSPDAKAAVVALLREHGLRERFQFNSAGVLRSILWDGTIIDTSDAATLQRLRHPAASIGLVADDPVVSANAAAAFLRKRGFTADVVLDAEPELPIAFVVSNVFTGSRGRRSSRSKIHVPLIPDQDLRPVGPPLPRFEGGAGSVVGLRTDRARRVIPRKRSHMLAFPRARAAGLAFSIGTFCLAVASCGVATPDRELTAIGTDYALLAPDTLPAGPVVLRFENRGRVWHEIVFARIRDDVINREFSDSLLRGAKMVPLRATGSAVLITEPGPKNDLVSVRAVLQRGSRYATWCQMRDSAGAPKHDVLGMLKLLAVR